MSVRVLDRLRSLGYEVRVEEGSTGTKLKLLWRGSGNRPPMSVVRPLIEELRARKEEVVAALRAPSSRQTRESAAPEEILRRWREARKALDRAYEEWLMTESPEAARRYRRLWRVVKKLPARCGCCGTEFALGDKLALVCFACIDRLLEEEPG